MVSRQYSPSAKAARQVNGSASSCRGLRLCLGLACLWATTAPVSAQTPAATVVVNTARADATITGLPATTLSNAVSIRIEELLDIGLAPGTSIPSVLASGVVAMPFTLANRGNGNEAFLLGAAVSGTANLIGFAIDTNRNGVFEPEIDAAIANQGATPLLSAGASLALFVLFDGGSQDVDDALTITARALTASGRPGTTLPGGGDQGCDAIVGLTTAMATLRLPLVRPSGATPEASIVKSQSVLAPGGSDRPVRGAVVTYTLDASFSGSGIARGARIEDPLPEGTIYVPGSLRLDGQSLTDGADADAGVADGAFVRVALGDIAAPAARSFSFQVTIK